VLINLQLKTTGIELQWNQDCKSVSTWAFVVSI